MAKQRFKARPGLIYIFWLLIVLVQISIFLVGVGDAQEKNSGGRPSAAGDLKQLELSLEDCLLKALRNNLNLKAEMITPQIADKNVTLANEKFVPSINFNYNNQNTKTASYSFLEASDMVVTKQDDYTIQLSENIPTGGSFYASLYSYVNDSNRSFQTINPRFGSTFRLNFSQPLLRDAGLKYGRRDIIIASYGQEISEENFQKILEDTIYNVELAYWNLVYAR